MQSLVPMKAFTTIFIYFSVEWLIKEEYYKSNSGWMLEMSYGHFSIPPAIATKWVGNNDVFEHMETYFVKV